MEIPFETLLGALEATRGTAIASPTHLLGVEGALTPTKTVYRPRENRGTLARNYRSTVTRRGCEIEGEQDADANILPFWLRMAVKGGVTPTTPAGATNARDWEFVRSIAADDLQAATLWFGDPNLQVWQADYCMLDELVLANDAADEEGVLTVEIAGMGGRPVAVSDPTVPASIAGAVFPGQLMQCWIDTSSAIGTTPVTGRLLSAEHTIRTGVTYKHLASGPTASMDFATTGREQISAISTKLVLELPDLTEYTQWEQHQTLKVRVRHNGPAIETITGPTVLYHFVEVDCYGPFDAFAWGENQGSNRTVELTIEGEVDATLGSDLRVMVRNARATL